MISAVPVITPVTTPVVLPTVAMVGEPDVHVPPPPLDGSLRVIEVAGQTTLAPSIVPALGAAFTLIVLVADAVPHILVTAYTIVAVPRVLPVTIPVALMDATAGDRELHMPPGTASLNNVESPAHTIMAPVITPANGAGLTVTTAVAYAAPHRFVTAYDIVVVPAATPTTFPTTSTVAIHGLELVHTPPGVPLISVVEVVGHTVKVPAIVPAVGNPFTVTTTDAATVPQPLVTV